MPSGATGLCYIPSYKKIVFYQESGGELTPLANGDTLEPLTSSNGNGYEIPWIDPTSDNGTPDIFKGFEKSEEPVDYIIDRYGAITGGLRHIPHPNDGWPSGFPQYVGTDLLEEIKQISDDGVWTYFCKPEAIELSNGNILVGALRNDGMVIATNWNPLTGERHEMELYQSPERDDHNNPSFHVLPSGNVICSYTNHGDDNFLRWRISTTPNPQTAADWTAEKTQDVGDKCTYSNWVETSDGKIWILSRGNPSGKKWSLYEYDPIGDNFIGQTWLFDGQFGDDNGYPRFAADGTDLWFVSGNTTPSVDESSVFVFRLDTVSGDIFDPDGTLIKNISVAPVTESELGASAVVFPYTASVPESPPYDDGIDTGRVWPIDIAVKGGSLYIGVLLTKNVKPAGPLVNWRTDAQRMHYYIAKWDGSTWDKRYVANAGNGMSSLSANYYGGLRFDPDDADVVYISSNEDSPFDNSSLSSGKLKNNFELYKGVRGGSGFYTWEAKTAFSEESLDEPEGSAGHFRPTVIGSHLVFLSGYYDWYDAGRWNLRIQRLSK